MSKPVAPNCQISLKIVFFFETKKVPSANRGTFRLLVFVYNNLIKDYMQGNGFLYNFAIINFIFLNLVVPNIDLLIIIVVVFIEEFLINVLKLKVSFKKVLCL